MPLFQYKAFQASGALAEGQIEAGGRQDAFRQMEEKGLKPISLSERAAPKASGGKGAASSPTAPSASAAPASGFSFKVQSKKVSPRMLENFTRLLSSLLAAGVPLSRALVILCKEASNPVAQAKWKSVYDSVVEGVTLADSMAKSPETFPRVYVAMVSAGETGGVLDVAGADRRFSTAGKGFEREGHGGHALSAHLVAFGLRRADFLDGVLYSAVPKNV